MYIAILAPATFTWNCRHLSSFSKSHLTTEGPSGASNRNLESFTTIPEVCLALATPKECFALIDRLSDILTVTHPHHIITY